MCCCVFYIIVRGVAQLVARLVRVQKAVGSSPVTPTKKPFMPYPGVDGFFDAEGRELEQDGTPQCAKNAEIRHFLVRGKVPPA